MNLLVLQPCIFFDLIYLPTFDKKKKIVQIEWKSYVRTQKLSKKPRKGWNLASIGGASGQRELVLFKMMFPFKKQKAGT
jgi:hypothetical protein